MGARENRTGIFEIPNEPELPDLFRVALRNLALSLRTHTVATVVTYDPTAQVATVTVDILAVVKDNITPASPVDPNPTATQLPVTLKDIPVAWDRTGSGYLTFPLKPGDKGELHVQDRSLEAWKALGQATDPIAAWTHNLADSVFHPKRFDATSPITPPTDLTATVLDGEALVKIGRLAVEFLIKSGTFTTLMDGMITAAVSAAAGITPPNGDGGTAAFTAFQTAWNSGKANIATIKAQGE